jgi:hypothetical protein
VRARLLLKEKLVDARGGIEQRVIWEVPRDDRHPDGYRYRLAYIKAGRRQPSVLYDNHHPKGHHKHLEDEEFGYVFLGLAKLLEDFKQDIQASE